MFRSYGHYFIGQAGTEGRSAFESGVYGGFAAVNHLVRKPENKNEQFALLTDVITFLVLVAFLGVLGLKDFKKSLIVKPVKMVI